MLKQWEIHHPNDIDQFYKKTISFLLENEVKNNLIIAILNRIKENPHLYGKDYPLLIYISKDDIIQLVAIRTPPFNLALSFTNDLNSIDKLVSYLSKKEDSLPGVLGFKEGSEYFSEKWKTVSNQNYELDMNERIYKLEKVNKQILDNRSNKFIKGDENYKSIILNWAEKFILEATPEDTDKLQGSLERVEQNLRDGEIFLLLHEDKPVSMARMAGETVNGKLINLVYTPPEFRKKGYATEVVACLSQYILDLGYDFCLLFTDLSNPTSNKIYMNIGYEPITDIDMYKFLDN